MGVTVPPENPDDLILQAIATAAQGHWAAAEPLVRRALALAPDRVDILVRGADFFAATDALSEAIALYDQALERHPQDADLWRRAAAARESLNDLEGAESACRRVLALQPEDAETWTHLGELLRQRNRREEALIAQRRALSLAPQSSQAWQNLAMLLVDLGMLDEAVTAFNTALKYQPNATSALSDLLFAMGFTQHWPAAMLRSRAAGWEQVALSEAERQAARAQSLHRPPLRQRRLRLGVLSSEFGHHAVGFFLWPWLSALDRARCQLFLYPTRLRPGPEAEAFKTLTDHWTPLVSLTDAQAAERIRADEIDVLVETSGHARHHRLGIVARRVAPVQCHYIGYFSTTGLSQMDYLIGDPVFTPPQRDGDFVEQVWRLPRSRYAYQPLAQAPEPAWHPDPQGRLWLASFNQLNKVREASLALWSRILRAQPNAQLLLKDGRAADPLVQTRILATLTQQGIAPERVKFVSHAASWSEHMNLYNYVDLALDPVPFTSATTGFDALWMGTPLVTLIGESPATRQAASMLSGLGRQEWIAQTGDDYVRIALALLQAVEQRRHIRLSQRATMRESELCDGAGLAAVLLEAFEQMFEHRMTEK